MSLLQKLRCVHPFGGVILLYLPTAANCVLDVLFCLAAGPEILIIFSENLNESNSLDTAQNLFMPPVLFWCMCVCGVCVCVCVCVRERETETEGDRQTGRDRQTDRQTRRESNLLTGASVTRNMFTEQTRTTQRNGNDRSGL